MWNLTELQEKIKYNFKDISLLENALTHSSYLNEHKDATCSYERLEFLGDAVLGLMVNEKIYSLFEKEDEGFMSKLKASVVCEQTLAGFARKLGYDRNIRMGHSEMLAGGMNRDSVLCDCFEAVLAAIYLDGGFERAKSWLYGIITDEVYFSEEIRTGDYKTRLQEEVQKTGGQIVYKIISQSGPDHKKIFEAEVCINGQAVARGKGSSKKNAEQSAAEKALKNRGV